jgi:hypothetical protein
LQVGWLGWRSAEDEELVRAIADACAYDSGRQRNTSGRPPFETVIFLQISIDLGLKSHQVLKIEGAMKT